MTDPAEVAVKAAMGVAKGIVEGRYAPSSLDAAALEACREGFGTVAGTDDELWPLQCDVARQVLAAGGIPAGELSEWLAVQRAREGITDEPEAAGSWIERMLALGDEDDEPFNDGGIPAGVGYWVRNDTGEPIPVEQLPVSEL